MPVFYILLAAVSIPLASGISAVLSRWLTLQVSAGLCLASALLGLALWGMAVADLPGAAYAAYIAAYSLEILYDTLFWLLASEYLTTLDMKRHAAQLAMAFGAGGVGGGLLASLLSQYIATQTLLLVSSFLFILSFLQCLRIGRRLTRLGDGEDEEEDGSALEAIKALAGTIRSFPLVGAICGGILLMSALFCLQDYLAMTVYAEAFEDEDDLAGFLAVVYSAQQAAELIILALFGRIVLERGGPMLRNMIFPVTTVLSLCGLFCFWGLPAAVVMHMNANAVSNAIFEPVKTLNYAAIPYRMLGQVRMLAEGVIYPAGIALSGIGLLWLQSMAEPRTTLLVTLCLAALFAFVCGGVGAGFLPSLLRSLRQRAAAPAGQIGRAGMSRFSRADVLALENHPDPQVRRYAAELRSQARMPSGGHRRSCCCPAAASGRWRGAWSTGRRKPVRRRPRRWAASATPPSPKRRSGSCRPGRRWRTPPSWRSARSDRGAPGGCCSTICARFTGRRTITCMAWPPCAASAPRLNWFPLNWSRCLPPHWRPATGGSSGAC